MCSSRSFLGELDIDYPLDPFDVYRVLAAHFINPGIHMYFATALTRCSGRLFCDVNLSFQPRKLALVKVDNMHAMSFPMSAGSRQRRA